MRIWFFSAVLALTGLLFSGDDASADWVDLKDVVQVELRAGWRAPEGHHMAAVEITLAPGWKTYWRWPGQAGFVPEASWRRSRNLQDVEFHWPTPTVGLTSGYRTVGYTEHVIIPLQLTPNRTGAQISLRGRLEIGVCADICIPASFHLRGKLPAAGEVDPDIMRALHTQPKRGEGRVACRFAQTEHGLALRAELPAPRGIGELPVVAVETQEPGLWFGDAKLEGAGGKIIATSRLHRMSGASVDRSTLRFTIVGTNGAVEFLGCHGAL